MKYIIKTLVALFFLPFIVLAVVIAILKTIITITLLFAWQKGDDWYGEIMIKIDKFMQWMK